MRDRAGIDRVLQVHTRYRQAGGEDEVVESERQLLEAAGITVRQVIFDNADLRESRSLRGDLVLAASAIWSRSAERRVRTEIAATNAQVVHVHNTFPAASPSVYSAAAAAGVRVVQTLHNYRLVCPAATAFRNGHVCTDCLGRAIAMPAVVHACVRGSRSQSAVAGTTIAVHRAIGTYRTRIARYLALSSFQRDLLVAGGYPATRIRVLSNFLEPDPGEGPGPRAGIVYAGRLSPEKGILPLLGAAAKTPGLIKVIGEGPLAPAVRAAAASGLLTHPGALPRAAVQEELRRAVALVLPSLWFEGFPMVVVEAFASGTPVIASRIGSLAELVDDGVTGLVVEPNDPASLAERIRWAYDNPEKMRAMGRQARHAYEARYRGPAHLAGLVDAYLPVAGGAP
ncbi:MAG: glycosyltransferase family 4 protein [Chloroflexi bacterium]|nr:glycosyltransferase family 4 protein [Chloroflexota bacterium]